MAHDSYIPIPKDLTVAVVCSDPELSQAFKKVLERILITMVETFERGEDAIKRFQTQNFDMLYMLGDPIDMTAFTLIRAARSGAVSAIFPAALVVDEEYYLSSDEKDFLQSYSVTLIKTDTIDERKIGAHLSDVFAERQQPTSFQMRLEHAKSMLREGMLAEAEEAFREMLEDEDKVAVRVGLLHASVENPQQYWKQLKALIALDPENYNFKFEMVERYMHEGRAQEASHMLDTMMNEMKTNPQLFWLNELGVVCVNLRFYSLAATVAQRLARVGPEADQWKSDLLLARMHMAAGNVDESKKFLTSASSVAPRPTPEIENLWAIHARRERNYETAIARYNAALQLSPGDYRIIYNIGLCYEHLGDKQKAKQQYQKALDLCPTYEKAKEKVLEQNLQRTVGLKEVVKPR